MLSGLRNREEARQQFAQLYQHHVEQVYRFLFFRLGNQQDAQDVTAQTFLSAWESFASFRGQSSVATWLFVIARRRLVDYFRSRGFTEQQRTQPLESVVELPDRINPPLVQVMQRLQVEQVVQALGQLSDERAEALSLRLFAGLSAREIAQVMNKSEAAVKMLVHRGLGELKGRLPDEDASLD